MDQNEPEIRINRFISPLTVTGTKITLSDFHEGKFEEIDPKILVSEIEKHFESLLQRNLIIRVIDQTGNTYECVPFDYKHYNKNVYIKELNELYITNSKKFNTKNVIKLARSVKITLVTSNEIEFDRPIFVASNGRMINKLISFDLFRTNNKLKLSNKNFTGIIETYGILEPTPNRKEIRKTDLAKALFNTILKYEDEFFEYYEKETASNVTRTMRKFENSVKDVVKNFLSKKIHSGSSVEQIMNREYKFHGFGVYNSANNIAKPQVSKPNRRASGCNSKFRGPKLRDKLITINYPLEKTTEYNTLNNLDFKIEAQAQPVSDINGNILRSIKRGSQITVFKKHPDFQERVSSNAKGQFVMNERISYFLAMEIMTHLYNELRVASGVDSESALSDFATSVHELENELKSLAGKKF
ncbi:MAG: hypothetical protein K1X86_00065 [Ignavibacteria bacterium]|nr:hypothetical protein [Ignavibacteria bacterium]